LLNRTLYDAFGVLYALALVLLFIDAVQPRRAVNRTAIVLLFLVFTLQSTFLLVRLESMGYAPVYSSFDATLLLSWLMVLVALVINAFFRIDLIMFFANVLGFGLIVFDTFSHPYVQSPAVGFGDLLVLHITLALLSYVGFAFAFVFSFMYLIQDRLLRRKQWTGWYFRLPSLERLDAFCFRSVLISYPLLLLAMVLGAVWERLELGHFLLLDPKPIATLIVWMLYGVYLLLRQRRRWSSSRLMYYSVFCFVGVILNFVVIGSFSLFHRA